ncbi:SDR family NAD(P)-dependent oxidoreductase [Candidatus Thiothrix sp. Deng01]|uniref:SDR family NAD(P)-dependent oxidoreductase n=1 Tax=Candidatus Thiothrix phosphatis TaxID=3112415 RepID=A0ABU6D1V4_9GAMM|nr:SDR family NAD(P)-dependent oxidoreductase [Candidatus Thiothrix sp. Deng01]MEB4593025.1 SDR family NAD(P)-dependent oxidoreductase [Candidatus Thiothrix sp. Deng01]
MRNVLITGCSSGIGYCVAKGLRERGYQVFASARQEKDVERLEGEGFKTLQLDLADPESVQDAVYELMLRTNSELYAVFHNGAYGQAGALEDISREALERQFAVNVFGWHQLTNMLMPILRQRNEGRIIYNSSILGYIALPFRGAYNASKYAIEGIADTLRLELADTDIKVCLIEPGPIESSFRINALQSLKEHVNIDQSVHRLKYQGAIRRLEKEGPAAPFTLPPEAVLKKVICALESPNPKARYPVTMPAHLFWALRRFLPERWMDKILLQVANSENQ